MFRHPKYYKELRDAGNELAKRNAVKEDLACSGSSPLNKSDQVISKANSTRGLSCVHPGPGLKRQASSSKLQAFEPTCSSIKPQATSPEAQASSFKPQATSSVILVPRYMDIEKVFLGKGPRAFTMIKVFLG